MPALHLRTPVPRTRACGAQDLVCEIAAYNRSSERAAPLHILPHMWLRNTWAWGHPSPETTQAPPEIRAQGPGAARLTERHVGEWRGGIASATEGLSRHPRLGVCPDLRRAAGERWFYVAQELDRAGTEGDGEYAPDASAGPSVLTPVPMLFCNNDTNYRLLYGAEGVTTPFPKDGINDHVVSGRWRASPPSGEGGEPTVNPEGVGTKCAGHAVFESVPPGACARVWVRFSPRALERPFDTARETVALRKREADEFYAVVQVRQVGVGANTARLDPPFRRAARALSSFRERGAGALRGRMCSLTPRDFCAAVCSRSATPRPSR